MNISDLNLKENPFENLTPIQDEVKNWAGMKEIKHELESIYHNSFQRNFRTVVLNYGTFGGGKTYAAYYFKNRKFAEYTENQILNIYATPPSDGNKLTQQIFHDIIDGITFNRINSQINKAIKELGEKELFQMIFKKINSEEFSKAIVNIGKDGNILNSQILALTQRYLYGNISNQEMSKLGLNRKLTTDTDYNKFLAGIIIAITATQEPVRIFYWLDELESLIYYTSKQYREFSQNIRYLADTVGERFTIFMNFTFSESEEENIRMLIGEALWTRVDKKIYFNSLTIEQALDYCRDLLHISQINSNQGNFSPFDESTINKLLKELKPKDLIPREINRNINSIIEFALNENTNIIDIELYKNWFNSKNQI